MKRIIYACVVGSIFLMVGIGILFHHAVIGLSAHSVLSGSMEPTISTGSLALAVARPEYRDGDIVVFTLPGKSERIMHRIVRTVVLSNGQAGIETKGDANTDGDLWQVPAALVQGKVIATIPFMGYVFHQEDTPLGFGVMVIVTFFGGVVGELYLLRAGIRAFVSSAWSRK